MATSQFAGILASALGLSQEIRSTFVKGFSKQELEILCQAADYGIEVDNCSSPYLPKLIACKFIIPQQNRLQLNIRKDFFCNYILYYRDAIDSEALVHFAVYSPTELAAKHRRSGSSTNKFIERGEGLGCGVCLDDCSTEAISLVPRENAA